MNEQELRTKDDRLYERSVAAAKRYCGRMPRSKTEIGKLLQKTEFEFFRVGWMMGHRAGQRANK